MNIVVCIKQVPDTARLKFDAETPFSLDGAEWVMNPFCEYAVETALRLKESVDGSKLTAISVGLPQARETLKRAIAMGCDEAILISDEAFKGADAWTTANILAKAIQKQAPDFDLILFGQLATDSMTGITGPATAALLDIPSITFAKKAILESEKTLTVHRETEQGEEVYQISLPGLVCTMKCDYEPRIPSIKGVMKANRTEIPVLSKADLDLTENALTHFTQVEKTWTKPKKQGGIKIDGADTDAAVNQLMTFLHEAKVV